jgi:hypothetical protein
MVSCCGSDKIMNLIDGRANIHNILISHNGVHKFTYFIIGYKAIWYGS